MAWEIQTTDEFEEWLLSCDDNVQEKVAAMFPLLREEGPELSRPFADTMKASSYPNMKELRPTKTVRVFFAFDPTRTAILLIGGDKIGKVQDRWYKDMIRTADALYASHLAETKENKRG